MELNSSVSDGNNTDYKYDEENWERKQRLPRKKILQHKSYHFNMISIQRNFAENYHEVTHKSLQGEGNLRK